jgi:cytochrome c oxidase assembly protein subunit 15
VIYVAILWTAQRLDDDPSASLPTRMRSGAIGLLVLVLAQIYLGALVAGLRAGHIYDTWPLIDGAFVPDASRLFFHTPLWRNFFENTLTVQFDHRILAYIIFIAAIFHAFRAASRLKAGPAVTTAIVLAAAVMLQVLLGVATLLLVAPLSLALLHQAMAMVVLTTATVHAAAIISGPSAARNLEAVAAPAE